MKTTDTTKALIDTAFTTRGDAVQTAAAIRRALNGASFEAFRATLWTVIQPAATSVDALAAFLCTEAIATIQAQELAALKVARGQREVEIQQYNRSLGYGF